MVLVRLLFLAGALSSLVGAQTCSQYANTTSTGACDCPPGFTGADCASLACGNPLQLSSSRPAFAAGASGSAGCGTQCTDGFSGPTCNLCTSANACSAAIGALTGAGTTTASGGSTTLSGVLAGGTDDVICNQASWTWTESFVSCNVVNPTLQSVYPGSTTLSIQKTVDPSLSLASNSSSAKGTTLAQLFYSSNTGNATLTEQFYCRADSCAQSNSTSSGVAKSNWDCSNLACKCIPGTFICGGGGGIDLTQTVNGLAGTLSIECDADGGGNCSFVQKDLQTLFGAAGLSLSGCTFGECVRPSTISALASTLVASTTNGSSGLSTGVIAGLAVLGAIVGALLLLIALGYWKQRKARNALPGIALEKDTQSIGLRWTNIGYALPSSSRRVPFLPKSTHDDGKILLNGITGSVAPAQLLAILGPTGAGKSTLVDILAGKRKSGRASGRVELLGAERGSKVTIGYVDQEDVLPATSTVSEALMFAAELKLGEAVSTRDKSARVFEVLEQLRLVDVADSLVGSSERRGISGGERRRLSIGLELLSFPSILVLDEPTSGLDSSSALRVVQVLKALAHPSSGRATTVIATIHQPSSQIWAEVDEALVLGSGGHQVYAGSARNATRHFADRGFECPEGWNPADFLLQLASDPPPGLLIQTSHLAPSDTSSDEKTDAAPVSEPMKHKTGLRLSKPVTCTLTQFEVLAGRELRNLKRDWSLVLMHNVVAIIVGLFVGGLYYKVNLTIGGFQSRIGSLFFLGSLLAFSSLSALSNFVNVKPLFLRERAGAYYSPVAWFLSRVAFDIIPLRILPTILVSCIVYWMVGLSPTAAHFFKYLLILCEYNIATTLWNFFLAAAIADSGIAILVSAVLNLFQMAYAGFFVNLASIPPVLRWLQYVSPLKFALEALAVNEVSSGLMIDDTLQGVKVQVSASLIMEVLFGFKPTAYYRDVLVLFAFIGGFAGFVVVTVVWRLREMR